MKKYHIRKDRIVLLLITLGILVLLVGAMIIKKSTAFHFEKQLDVVAIQVDQEKITLKEFNYYIYLVEKHVQEQALIYNKENPLEYWNLHFSAGTESAFIRDMAKDTAYETCVCDVIYSLLADKTNIQLSEVEKEAAINEAQEIFQKFTIPQLDHTGLDQQIIEKVILRKKLAEKCALEYAKNINKSLISDTIEKELSATGNYYQTYLLSQFQVEINQEMKNSISLGGITVN